MEQVRRGTWTGLGVPPAYDPASVVGFTGRVTGRRVVVSTIDGWEHDCRAWDEPYLTIDGPVVPCVTEMAWYRWRATKQEPRYITAVPTQAVWIEAGVLR